MRAYLGTGNGVWRLNIEDGTVEDLGLNGSRFWAIHAWSGSDGQDVVLAGSYGEGIFRSDDGGRSWTESSAGLSATALRVLQTDPTEPDAVLAGTEPARGFRSLDGGQTWTSFAGIERLDGTEDWFLPYSPRAGALRNFAATTTGELYASIEVGGLLHSPDRGENWHLIAVDPGPRVHDDIHQVIVDPRDDRTLYVAMGGALVDRTHGQWLNGPRQIGGVAVSTDGGSTWTKLLRDYTRAVMIPESAPEWLLAAPAERTDHGGWIEGSIDRGATWERIDDGISTPTEDMIERFAEAPDGSIWAISSGGRIYSARPGDWQWSNPLGGRVGTLDVESISFVSA